MSSSVFGSIREDTISRIENISPTHDSRQSWKHIPDDRRGEGPGRGRIFRTLDPEPGGDDVNVVGGGERQESWILPVETTYSNAGDTADRIASDHVDLIAALHPSSGYPSGLRVRSVDAPELDRDEDTKRVTAVWPIRVIFRYDVTLVV